MNSGWIYKKLAILMEPVVGGRLPFFGIPFYTIRIIFYSQMLILLVKEETKTKNKQKSNGDMKKILLKFFLSSFSVLCPLTM